ncbi:uncharacterized, partial [Tachysurus ichikawai]
HRLYCMNCLMFTPVSQDQDLI